MPIRMLRFLDPEKKDERRFKILFVFYSHEGVAQRLVSVVAESGIAKGADMERSERHRTSTSFEPYI